MQIIKANKSHKKLRIGLFGDSGNGKTHTAITMAQVLGSRILIIDSEDGASHSFSDLGDFSVLKIDDPTIEAYSSALDVAIKNQNQFDVVVIDSMSHAWQNALAQVATHNNTQLGWGKITPKWDALVHKIKRLDQHVVVTFRMKSRNIKGSWIDTFDCRENSDYDFDLMLKMTGVRTDQGRLVAKAEVTKNRFNTANEKLKVGGMLNAGPALIKYILDWQTKAPTDQETPTPTTGSQSEEEDGVKQ